jgi:hypothetical protein
MTLIVLTVVVIVLLIAALGIFLFRIGMLLNRTADGLADCVQNVEKVARQAEVIGPGIERINEIGTRVVGALPLLCDGAERIGVAKGAPYVDPSEARHSAPSAASTAVTSEAIAAPNSVTPAAPAVASAAPSRGVGYLDDDGPRGSLGLLDA